MSAPIALLNASAEGENSSPAVANVVAQGFPLLTREHRVPARQELALMSADHIGHLGPMRVHRSRSRSRSSESTSGLGDAENATAHVGRLPADSAMR